MCLTCCFLGESKNRIYVNELLFCIRQIQGVEDILFCRIYNSQTIVVKAILALIESILLRK